MQARSSKRKSEILAAARRLLLERGFEGMTIAMVARSAKASVGSVTHFFETKERLAESVAEEVSEEIAAEAQTALRSGRNVEQAVRNLIAAALGWAQKFPRYRELVGYAGQGGAAPVQAGLQRRLEKVLADWTRTLTSERPVAVLSSAELFAVVLAPAMCDTSDPILRSPIGATQNWGDLISRVAIRAVLPAEPKAGKATKSSRARGRQPDLFRGVLDREPPQRPKQR
jgi:AcrR family transcriptional regulator